MKMPDCRTRKRYRDMVSALGIPITKKLGDLDASHGGTEETHASFRRTDTDHADRFRPNLRNL